MAPPPILWVQSLKKATDVLILLLVDVAGIAGGTLFGMWLLDHLPGGRFLSYAMNHLSPRDYSLFVLVFLLFFGTSGLYTKRMPFWDEAREICSALSSSIGVILLVLYFFQVPHYVPFLQVAMLWISGCLIVPTIRYLAKVSLFHLGVWRQNILILGVGKSGVAVAEGILRNPFLGYHVVGFLDDDESKIGKRLDIAGRKLKVFGKIRHFRKFVRKLYLSTVVISMPSMSSEQLSHLTTKVQKFVRNILLVPDLKGIALLNTQLHHLFDQQLFLLKINNNLLSLFNQVVKRIFDLALCVILLPVVLPLIGLITMLIYLESGGPAFFVQARLGRNRSVFPCIKFRTMFPNADAMLGDFFTKNPDKAREWQEFKKIKGFDPRVTRVGSFLRQTSLDELPQIFNVLLGQMSLVGPRPYLPREVEDMKGFIDTILLTTPGITGLWQVRGRNEMDFAGRLRLDAWYVLNWTIWADIEILFKTILVVFFRKGAY